MTKFTVALREIATYKEVLRLQVEHMLNDRLTQFVSIDLQDVKEVRKRFDKANFHYDQSLSIACYFLNDLLHRGGGEEWLCDQCILREAAGGGRSLGLI
jgi:hypothetical protein